MIAGDTAGVPAVRTAYGTDRAACPTAVGDGLTRAARTSPRAGGRGIGSGLPPGPAACYTARMAKKRKQAAKPPAPPLVADPRRGQRKAAEARLDAVYRRVQRSWPRPGPGPGRRSTPPWSRPTGRSAGSSSRRSRRGRAGPITASGSWRGSPGGSRPSSAGASTGRTSSTCGRSSWPTRKSTHCVDNYPGPTTASSSASRILRRGRSTRPRRSTPAGRPASSSGRSVRCCSSGWP